MTILTDADFDEKVRGILAHKESQCAYPEFREMRKALRGVCLKHGSDYESVEIDQGCDFLVLEDWFKVRELCVNEVREGAVTGDLIKDIIVFLRDVNENYMVIISADDVRAKVKYNLLIYKEEIFVTVERVQNSDQIRSMISELPWFGELMKS